ncbi:sulfite exporter TauE/SafE family protein [Bradyrhizobium sp. HKCCYLR20261]|uniref:sulfite exporter TauE/SafE family protein n=1 Tax=unclassified Bradyrhizobium TaxID=2631580 RepID=UPI003EBF713A
MISALQGVLGLLCGAMVGFSLGLVGGGGSVLAVPLMVYVVGVPEPHIAIGSSAIAVATNAAINLANHARGGTVIWPIAALFAAAGIVGAFTGSLLGKMVDGQKLLALFALVMMVIALLMLKTRARIGIPDVKMSMANVPAILGFGLATGTLSGFFGIGGGFLIVPALMAATGMPIMNAVSSSLVAVTTFGLTTAASYAWSGLVAWDLAGLFIAGGIAGGLAGTRLARHLSERRGALNIVFSVVIAAVALYMLTRSLLHIWS